jgi:hypothetical protein
MQLRHRTALALVLVCALAAPAAGLAAPANVKLPTISGKPNYDQKLTCNPGTWSADAKSFDYQWLNGESVEATTKTFKVPVFLIGYQIRCRVIAHDAGGGATSADSASTPPIGQGLSTLKLNSVKLKNGTITLKGKAGPKKALRDKYGKAYLVLYRKNKDSYTQITPSPVVVPKDGKFKIVAHDHGKHNYILTLTPPSGTSYGQKSLNRKWDVPS